jgi:hypothetical protein
MKRHDVVFMKAGTGQVRLLTQSARDEMASPDDGIIKQLTQNLPGFTMRTDSELEAFAKRQVTDPRRQGELITRIRALGLSPTDGTKAREGKKLSLGRIHETLMLIGEAKTGVLPRSVSKEGDGTTLFGLKPIVRLPQLSDAIRAEMVSEEGILEQLTQNLQGFATRTDSTLEELARREVTEPVKQSELLTRLEALGLYATDAANAKNGFKPPQDRIHEALMLMAEAKEGTRPELVSKEDDGTNHFGFEPIRRADPSPRLADPVRDEMLAEDGIFAQAIHNIPGFRRLTDTALEAFASEQITATEKQEPLLAKLRRLGITPRDVDMALEGNALAQDRIHEALALIYEVKRGERPTSMSKSADGTSAFGWAPAPKVKKAPELSDPVRGELLGGDGLLAQLDQSFFGFGSHTDSQLVDFAKAQVPHLDKQAPLLDELQALGIKADDGNNARAGRKVSQDRIREALMLIAKAKTGARPKKLSKAPEGTLIFGLKAVGPPPSHSARLRGKLDAIIPPTLSVSVRDELMSENGILIQMQQNFRGFATKPDSILEDFAKAQVTEMGRQLQVLSQLEALGLTENDIDHARAGSHAAQDRLHEALMLIAEGKLGGRPSSISKEIDGINVFGLKAIAKTKKPAALLDSVRKKIVADDGIISQLNENLSGFTYRFDSLIEDFATEQVREPSRTELLPKLRALGIKRTDGRAAKANRKAAQDRIIEALMLIAEAKTGQRPSEIGTRQDGTHWFGLK